MPTALEQTNQNLAELISLVKAKHEQSQNPKTELQWEDVVSSFDEQIKTLVNAQVDEKIAAMPQRRVGGAPISAEQHEQLKGNRYAKMVKAFAEEGGYKDGWQTLKPVDLFIAAKMMERQEKFYNAGLGGNGPVAASNDLKAALKAMTSTGVGTGDEIVPLNMAPQLWEDIFLASIVVSNMQRITMPSNPFDVPLGLGRPTWRKGAENTATTATDLATAKVTMAATEILAEVNWSYTLDEDAIIAMAPAIRASIAQSGAETIDSFALNADSTATATGNINSDDGAPAAGSYYLSEGQDGLRHAWLVDAAGQGVDAAAALTDAKITAMLAKLGKYGVRPGDLLMVTDSQTYLNGFLSTATGAPGTFLATMNEFGPSAIILTGQVAQYRGIPIVLSASSPLTEADGKVSATPANNTKGSITVFNRNMWYVGFRRDLLVEADRDIQKRQYIVVASLRQALAAHGARASIKHAAGLYNITV